MNKFTLLMKNLIKSFSVIGIFCFSIFGFSQEGDERVLESKTLTTPTCVFTLNDYEGSSSVLRTPEVIEKMAGGGSACSTFNVNYSGFTPEAEAAFQFAVDIWSMSIESPQPITISANFAPLAPNTLGQAGAVSVHTVNHPDAVPNTWYPKAIAEKILDQQINPDPFGNSVDITAEFSSTANFYFGTDAMPPANQIDFVSVVLHEIGHGLGFGTSFRTTDGTTGSIREPNSMRAAVYDLTIENGSGQSLLNTAIFPDPSTALHGQLTGNNLFNNAPIATAQNGGVIPKSYAPNPYQGGSSYSHWDADTFPLGNPNSLMRPGISSGVANHNPGAITLGLFEDMGWSICGGSLTVDEFSLAGLSINPNPFTSSIKITLLNGLNDDYDVALYDIKGRVVASENLTANNGTMSLENLSSLEDALYFVKITNALNGSSITKKIIKN